MHSHFESVNHAAMANRREPRQVAKRALILGTIAFRASLEVTDHPRVLEISRQLLPWLTHIRCADELDPIERELLETPFGQLSDSQKMDANWAAGEAALFFCWMLNRAEPLHEKDAAVQSHLPETLLILQPDASEIIQFASLRDIAEIEDTCRHFILILSLLRESRIDAQSCHIIRERHVQQLNDVGLAATEDAIRRASETVDSMTPQQRCFVVPE
jgi:hypothetical protein